MASHVLRAAAPALRVNEVADSSAAAARAPCVVALDMGYGHLRAAAAIASACDTDVALADRPPLASEGERATWARARRWYERLSRAATHRYFPGANRLLELLTAIAPPQDSTDRSRPTAATRALDRLIRDGLGAGLAARVKATGETVVSTFYAPAIAADAHGAERVHLVVTDSDIHRVWVASDARRSRIVYLAPTETVAARLASYGVQNERIRVTGFPLPPELVGEDDVHVREALAARLVRLDPEGTFRRALRTALPSREAGEPPGAPLTLVYAVGGAGAQAGIARQIVRALREQIASGRIRVVLVAGTRPCVEADFRRWVAEERAGEGVSILYEPSFAAYHRRFNETLAGADLLWTKPSELTFFGALGIPLLLAPPLGVHERRNRAWALSVGAGIDASDVRLTVARLPTLLREGSLAKAAWSGFTRMSREGTRRIVAEIARQP
jgi:hypothetical protein